MGTPSKLHPERRPPSLALALLGAFLVLGCGPRIVTIKFPDSDPTTEYVVCDQRGTNCRGKKDGDVPPDAYSPKLDVLVPMTSAPGSCKNGVRTIEIVVKKNRVTAVGYECATREEPTPLPPDVAAEDAEQPSPTPSPLLSGEPPPPPVESL